MPGTRFYAVKALSSIFLENARPKESIESYGTFLDRRDRAFMMEIVYGVLRHRDTLDWILERFLKNPRKLPDMTRNNLRTAVYQLLFMRVPHWAVVNESVEMEKEYTGDAKPGVPAVVNAVLRNLIRQQETFKLPLKFDDPVTDIAVNTSHPAWMAKRWIKRFGEAQTRELAAANNQKPPLTLRANTLRTTRGLLIGTLTEKGISADPSAYAPEGILVRDNVTHNDLSFAGGLFIVQDEASQLVTHLLNPLPGQRILDACAAPGGKTTHIAQLIGDNGEIIAVERDAGRLERLRENVNRLGMKSVGIIRADVTELRGHGTFDRVLLDAPCSATGVIRRNPDVKYRHRGQDLAEFGQAQLQLLRAVSVLVKKGGTIVYSVCSIEPEEGEEVIKGFLKTNGDFGIIDAGPSVPGIFVKDGLFMTFPHRYNMDGFFGAVLCRKD
ncbi:MAG: 16S rRNA (cytosine(967)-C(5))-methyltransferase RsmB [Nitrospirae bacterium]|nr:16S rRNA (cytosine(967)-C(5))-methyltransferase RsmB [Nitrospirota bacterium]